MSYCKENLALFLETVFVEYGNNIKTYSRGDKHKERYLVKQVESKGGKVLDRQEDKIKIAKYLIK